MCKDRAIKGYSKLKNKADLIRALLDNASEDSTLQANPKPASVKPIVDPATTAMLQRASTKTVYSREESEKRIEKNKNIATQRVEAVSLPTKKVAENDATVKVIPSKGTATGAPTASSAERLADTLGNVAKVGPQKPAGIEKNKAQLAGIFGPPPDKMAQYEAVEQLVKTTTSKAPSKQKDTATSAPKASSEKLANTFGKVAKTSPQRPAEPPSSLNTGKTGQKLVVPSTQIQKASAKAENLDDAKPAAVAVTNTKTVYSREESEKRIEKNKALVAQRAEVVGIPAEKAVEKEATEKEVKATSKKNSSKQKDASKASSAGKMANSIAAGKVTKAIPQNPAEPPSSASTGKTGQKLVISSTQIQKASAEADTNAAKPAPTDVTKLKPDRGTKSKRSSSAVATSAPSTSTQASKMVVQPQQIQKISPAVQSKVEEPKEMRLQQLSSGEQTFALKKLSKNAYKMLKLRKQDFMKKKAKDLEKILEVLEIEKGKFTVYQPTDKMLRNFIDESIKLINEVKEEQINKQEQFYVSNILPQIIKKNEGKIKKITGRIDRYYTDLEAAKDIVEKVIKNKSPFPPSYLVTVILQKIRDKTIWT